MKIYSIVSMQVVNLASLFANDMQFIKHCHASQLIQTVV